MTPANLQRIAVFEYKYNEVSQALADLDMALDSWANVKDWLDELREYQDSGQWMKDFEADERGELPKDLRRGVLTEDALWDLLEVAKKIKERMRMEAIGDTL